MQVIRSVLEASISDQSVVAIGNFDGFHLGHRAILDRVQKGAVPLGAAAVAITFEPHPLKFLTPERAPKLIATLDQKIRLLSNTGIDLLLIQEFNEDFSRLSPEQFIDSYLIKYFNPSMICVSHNFRFGHRHAGNLDTLLERPNDFQVVEVPPVTLSDKPISSSGIRGSLARGDVGNARKMLGRYYEIEGSLVSGFGRGHRETVPTLNIKSNSELLPADGVYVTLIALDGGPFLPAITNVGIRPTFAGTDRTVETHVLDFQSPENHVGACLQFLKRLRDEKKYCSSEELRSQIEHDVVHARRFFHRFNKTITTPSQGPVKAARSNIVKEIRIEMYSRPGCPLCDEAHGVIERARSQFNFNFQVINIEGDAELEATYGSEIPLVHINGNRAFKFVVDPIVLEKKLERLESHETFS